MQELAPGLGDSQRLILGLIKRRGPATVGELETASGLARESVRDHLGSLAAAGLVERDGVRRGGPGRPRVLYRLSERGEALFPQREGELLRQMASFLLADGREELLERFFESRATGKRRQLRERLAGLGGQERARAVARILDEEGFLPELEETEPGRLVLRLCHCPLREIVHVSQLPCRAEMQLAETLLGRRLRRESFMPDGDSSCSYSFAVPAPAAGANRSTPVDDDAPVAPGEP